jgi:CHAT domain-containing protein/Flp pilus assembly protein TadD
MDEFEQGIVELAEMHKDEFIQILEDKPVPQEEKGGFFLRVGLTLAKFSYFSLALNSWHHALKYFLENKDRFGELACYTNLGAVYQSLGDFRKAIEYHEKSLKIAREIGDKSGESKCYGNLGIVYYSLGDFRKAIEYHEESLKSARELGNKSGESACYGNLGIAYQSLGDFRKAIEYHEKSLKIMRELGNKSDESKCYTNLGAVYQSLGDFRKAIEYHEKSLKVDRELGNKSGESACYGNLGIAYFRLGDFRKAIEYYKKSLKIAREIGDKSGESKYYANLGAVYQSLGDFRKAIEYHEKSLKIMRELGNKSGESACYANLGAAHFSLGDFRKAIEYLEKSLKIDRELGDKSGESACYANLGAAYDRLGDFRKAIKYLKKSLKIIRESGSINLERIVNLNLCRIYYESEKEMAYKYCKRSIELSEMIGGRLVEEEKKIMFSTQTFNAYHYMIPLSLDLKKEKEAFDYTERSKSRAFLELLAATEINPTVEITEKLKSLLHNEQIHLNRLREIQTQHLRQTRTPVEPGEIEVIRENLDQIYDQINEIDPEYVYARRGKPLSFDTMQDMLSSQKRDVVLIEYFITEDKAIIFVISSKDGKLHIKTVPLSQETLYKHTENYPKKMAVYSYFRHIDKTFLELGKYLIEPVSDYLDKGDLIYFVPYGPLNYIPLHAVELRGEPLIKRHPVVYSPSASIIKFCKSKGSNTLKSCASFGIDPYGRIKETVEKEAEEVAGLFNSTGYTDYQATKNTVLKNCTDKDVIHFACHGYFDYTDPLSSGVVLHDKVLTAREIFDIRLTTELVTLSACQTGINETSPGDELIGLTRAFLYAGAPSVVVSLWSVDSPSTYELMLSFYNHLKNGADKATALQMAQIKIMEETEYTHPYYWAPFILVGDWQ